MKLRLTFTQIPLNFTMSLADRQNVMDGEEFRVKKGMTVYIPVGVVHQSFNDGDEDLCYFSLCPTSPGTK